MRLVKVRKKVFKREILDVSVIVVRFDILEMSSEDEDTILEHNVVWHLLPSTKQNEIDIESLLGTLQSSY